MSVAVLRFAVIGSPIAHSLSPRMHAAAFAALGLPHVYERLLTSAEELPARVAALRSGQFAGLNVTMPHKERVLALADEASKSARAIGAANTLVRSASGTISAHNTDAPALRQELEALRQLRGRSALVLGTGGAARAAVVALAELGASRIVVRGRNLGQGAKLAEIVPGTEVELEPFAGPPRERQDLAAIVQATTCGMLGGPPGDAASAAVSWSSVPEDAVALDVVYRPRETPFLLAARARGLVAADGIGMLARQGALAEQLWLGVPPPVDVMRAALSELGP